MSDVLVDLLPVMVGAGVVPLYPIIVLLLLQSQGGLSKATAFVTGSIAIRLAQGVLFGLVFGAAMAANSEGGQPRIASTLLLVIGPLLLVTAFKKWRAELGRSAGVGLYLFYTMATQMPVLLPILAYAIAPQRAAKPLQAAQSWLKRNNRVIVITVSLIFGVWFSYKGITGLIA